MRHIPVLLNEVTEYLNLKPGDNVVDCTLGDAGHAEAILERIGPDGKLIGIDADPESLLRSKRNLYRYGDRAVFVRNNFTNLRTILNEAAIKPVNAVLMDLGWSSPQFEERGRGFSFEKDEPLDMRFDPRDSTLKTAAEIVNSCSAEELKKMFKLLGEEKLADDIALKIIDDRRIDAINTTKQLRDLVIAVYRRKLRSVKEVPWVGGVHPATKVFQALRLAVNSELEALKQALPQAFEELAPGGRLAVITFHSLEDRIVKQYFASLVGKTAELITKKPVIASEGELEANRKARSAKLRVIKKL